MGCEYSVYLSFNIYAYVCMLMYTYIYGEGKSAIRRDNQTLAIHGSFQNNAEQAARAMHYQSLDSGTFNDSYMYGM